MAESRAALFCWWNAGRAMAMHTCMPPGKMPGMQCSAALGSDAQLFYNYLIYYKFRRRDHSVNVAGGS